MNKKIHTLRSLFVWLGIFLSTILCPIMQAEAPDTQSTGLGNAAASMMADYSPDLFMEELMNSPLLSDKDREELANLSPEEQAELFDSLMGFFNDPEIQKVLNDPKFLEEAAKLDEMMSSPEIDWDSLDFDSLKPEDKEPITKPQNDKELPPAPTKPVEPRKPTKEELDRLARMLKKITEHINSLERKSGQYEFIEHYFVAFKPALNELRFYLEVLQKPKNLEHLASDEFSKLAQELMILQEKLARSEPDIPVREVKPGQLYNPYEILGISRMATPKEIETRYEKLVAEKSPEHIKERLMVAGADEKKVAKKVKEAELLFARIKKAYEDLVDEEYRAEINRILDAERREQEGFEGLARLATENTITALDEAYVSPGTTMRTIRELLAKYDAEALAEQKKRAEEERKAAQKIEEFGKHPPARPTPPVRNGDYYNGVYPYPIDYLPGDYYNGFYPGQPTPGRPAPLPGGVPSPKEPTPPKKPEDADKKPGDKKDDKKPAAPDKPAPTKKPEQLPDEAAISIKELDALLTAIERGKEEEKKPEAQPAEPKADAAKEKAEAEKKEEKKPEPPKKPVKATDKEKKEVVDTLEKLKTDLTKDVVDETAFEEDLKKSAKRLRLKELNLKAESTLGKINGFYEKLQKQRALPHVIRMHHDQHKKLVNDVLKEHDLLLKKLKELTELTDKAAKNPDIQKKYFRRFIIIPDEDKPVKVEPTNMSFVKLQDEAQEFLNRIKSIEDAFKPKGAQEEKKTKFKR